MCLVTVVLIFFSIKERVYEIALRKSFGATDLDIVSMFLFEIFLCILFAFAVGVPVAFFVCVAVSFSVSLPLGMYVIPLNASIFIIPAIIISLVIYLIASIPLLYFAKAKIADSLKVV
jgi:ABC-type antimicrobial peptide transport system permease subunit